MRLVGILTLGLAGLLLLLLLAVSVGSTRYGFAQVLDALLTAGAAGDPSSRIVLDLRLPRAVLALIVGAGLGMVGAVLQTLSRNDLADPFLFGLSSGAAAGAVVVITVTGNLFGFWTLPAAAFAGGLTASIIVLWLIGRLADQNPNQLVLLAGDDAAATLGINVARFRRLSFFACAFATASFVALSGVIGAGLLLASDIAARTVLAPQELPIGVLTTSIDALFVLFLLRRAR